MSTSKNRQASQPGGSQSTRVNASRTRSSGSVNMTREELINLPYEVMDAKGGAAFLENKLLVPVGEPLTTSQLSLALLHITQISGIPKPAIEAMRSVAFLLEEEVVNQTVDTIASRVVVALSSQIADLHVTAEHLKKHTESAIQAVPPVPIALTNLTSALDHTQRSIDTLTEKIESLPAPTLSQTPSPANSYSAAVKNSHPSVAKVQAALSRAEVRTRQILFDPVPGQALHSTTDTSTDLATKINSAISSIRDENAPTVDIKSILFLRNGGILLEVASQEAADWIKEKQTKQQLVEKLGVQATIKDRFYSVIVPYLAISTQLSDPAFLRRVEEENEMTPETIDSARWIKPPYRRAEGQRVAHALFLLRDPLTADLLIRDGLFIDKEKLFPRKDKREPLRCVRCQGWGHIARNCKAKHNVCGTCGCHHRTADCSDKGKIYCASCKTDGHPSYSRNCPEFVRRCEQIDAKHPENQMPYFPTDEDWTQVLLPPKSQPYHRPTQEDPVPPRPTFRQTTLDFSQLTTVKPPSQRERKLQRLRHPLPPRPQSPSHSPHAAAVRPSPALIPTPVAPHQSAYSQSPDEFALSPDIDLLHGWE